MLCGTMVVATMTCYVGPSNIVGCTLGNVLKHWLPDWDLRN
jgi:hypothetical protein